MLEVRRNSITMISQSQKKTMLARLYVRLAAVTVGLYQFCTSIALDISPLISVARYIKLQRFSDSEKLDVIRANMHNPPFRDGVFDIVFSPRAIHHTGDMELAIQKLLPTLRTSGIFAYSVYSRENNVLMWGIIEPLKKIFNRHLSGCFDIS